MQTEVLTAPAPATTPLQVNAEDMLPLTTATGEHLLAEWQELYNDVAQTSYLQDPAHVLLNSQLSAGSELLPAKLLTCRDEQQLVAAAALIPKRISCGPKMALFTRRSLNGYRLAGSRFLGCDDSQTEIRTKLLESMKTQLAQNADFILFEDVELDSPMWQALQNLASQGYLLHYPQGVQPRLRIRFPEVPEDYWKQFSSKTRNTFRRKQKHLGETQLLKFTQPDQVPEFLRLSNLVSQRSWQTRQLGLRIANNSTERSQLEWEASAGVFRSYVLMQGDRPLAFLQGNQYRGWFNYEEVAYDQEFAARSPGTVLLLQVFEEMFKNDPPEVFDFGAGDADYKRMFASWTSQSGSVWLVSRRLSAQMIVRGLQAARATRQFGRALLAKAGMWRKVRQFLRRGTPANESKAGDAKATEAKASEGT